MSKETTTKGWEFWGVVGFMVANLAILVTIVGFMLSMNARMATKADIARVTADLKADIARVEANMATKADKADIARVTADIARVEFDVVISILHVIDDLALRCCFAFLFVLDSAIKVSLAKLIVEGVQLNHNWVNY